MARRDVRRKRLSSTGAAAEKSQLGHNGVAIQACPHCARPLFGPVTFCPYCACHLSIASPPDDPPVVAPAAGATAPVVLQEGPAPTTERQAAFPESSQRAVNRDPRTRRTAESPRGGQPITAATPSPAITVPEPPSAARPEDPAASEPPDRPTASGGRPRSKRWLVAALLLAVAGVGYWAWPKRDAPASSTQAALSPETAATLEAVREHLRLREVTRARARLGPVPTAHPRHPDVQRMNGEVAAQEAARDRALEVMKECLRKNDNACAARASRAAEAVDVTSDEARLTRERLEEKPEKAAARRPAPARPKGVASLPSRDRDLPPRVVQAPPAAPPEGQSACESLTKKGRQELTAQRYDDAIRIAEAGRALGFCPSAEQLKQDALRAKEAARR